MDFFRAKDVSNYVRGFHWFCKGLGIFQFMFSGFVGFRQGLGGISLGFIRAQ